jgi:signal transduction histidine kinase
VRQRLLLTTGAIALVAVLALGVPLGIVGMRLLRSDTVRRLQREADAAGSVIAAARAAGRPITADRVRDLAREGHRLQVKVPGGGKIEAGAKLKGDVLRAESGDDQVTAIAPLAEAREDAKEVWLAVAVLALGATAVAVLLAVVQARRLAMPVERLAARSARLADLHEEAPPAPTGIRELDNLGAALAAASTRIGDMVRREREFSANAAHQLRTPLAALRLRLEELAELTASSPVAHAESTAALVQADRLAAVIEEVERLARDAAGGDAACDLAAVVREHGAIWATAAHRSGRVLRTTASPSALVQLGAETARQILDVLVDNALVHGDGEIDINCAASRDGMVAMDVRDDGGAVLGEEIFERGRSSTGSAGLGLPLARTLARRAGGELSIAGPATLRLSVPVLNERGP